MSEGQDDGGASAAPADREVLASLAQFAAGVERLLADIGGMCAPLRAPAAVLRPLTAQQQFQLQLQLQLQPRGRAPSAPPAGTAAAAAAQILQAQQAQQALAHQRADTAAALADLCAADARLRAALRRLRAQRRAQAALARLDAGFARRTGACAAALLFRSARAADRLAAALRTAAAARTDAAAAAARPVDTARLVRVAGRIGRAASTAPAARGAPQGPFPPPALVRRSAWLQQQLQCPSPAAAGAGSTGPRGIPGGIPGGTGGGSGRVPEGIRGSRGCGSSNSGGNSGSGGSSIVNRKGGGTGSEGRRGSGGGGRGGAVTPGLDGAEAMARTPSALAADAGVVVDGVGDIMAIAGGVVPPGAPTPDHTIGVGPPDDSLGDEEMAAGLIDIAAIGGMPGTDPMWPTP